MTEQTVEKVSQTKNFQGLRDWETTLPSPR